jgi:hypothetical protein
MSEQTAVAPEALAPVTAVPEQKIEVKQPEAQPAAEKPKEEKSARFAAVMRKEQSALKKLQEVKALEAKIAEEKAKLEAFERTKASAKQDPFKLLEELGLTYEDLTTMMLNDKKPPADLAVRAVRDELENFKRQQEEERQRILVEQQQQAQAQQQKIIAEFRAGCLDFVKKHDAEYELINVYDAGNLVVDVIEQHFAQTQKILTTQEAASLVEKHLEEQAEKVFSSKKWKSRTSVPPPVADPEKQVAAQQRTLSNTLTSSTPAAISQRVESDRMKRALAALEGKRDASAT